MVNAVIMRLYGKCGVLHMNEVSNKFLNKVSLLIEEAKKNVKTAVNIAMVYTYFDIGRMIIEEDPSLEVCTMNV